jgi:hypothetical protein
VEAGERRSEAAGAEADALLYQKSQLAALMRIREARLAREAERGQARGGSEDVKTECPAETVAAGPDEPPVAAAPAPAASRPPPSTACVTALVAAAAASACAAALAIGMLS